MIKAARNVLFRAALCVQNKKIKIFASFTKIDK